MDRTGAGAVPAGPEPARLTTRQRLLAPWQGRARSLAFDALLAAFLTTTSAVELADAHGPLGAVAGVLLTAPAVLLRRRWPLATLAVGLAMLALDTTTYLVFVALHSTASRFGASWRTWAGAAAVYALFLPRLNYEFTPWVLVVLLNTIPVLIPVLTGMWVHQRTRVVGLLNERAETAERERDLLAERAVTAERRRIAREMHDVVAHRVSVIALQSGALTVVGDGQVADAAEVIRKSSTAALSELRDVLRVLREDDAEESAPGLDGIPALIADTPGDVLLDRSDELPEVDAAVSRAAYRVVQEALTNAGKHAPGAAVRVGLVVEEGHLVVTVANREPSGAGGAVPGSGYGLVGMRERVTQAGGELTTGPVDGGFTVRARFPLTARAE
ncbi:MULTISPECIES: histidine kinase [Actinosynnema]|uniref:sensor histidine kinase n=1 Tax=Actinosynnema TaxID=40566 RepID=UPI0020A37711|nr:histidine kinase [Actinosynnema pretiosum]MCP2098517.1 Signal transduction histidine kinase [Actinosynnema pretiosum]